MTETDWLTCTSRPADMLRQVRKTAPARKLKLLGCACCRLVWKDIRTPTARPAVTALERFADGLITEYAFTLKSAGLNLQWQVARRPAGDELSDGSPREAGLLAVVSAVYPDPPVALERCVRWVAECAARAAPDGEKQAALNRVRHQICDLFREVIGNPFRPWKAVPDFLGGGLVQPDGKTVRLTETARRLAEGIRTDQGYDRLPILADALEEAGVTDAEVLAHCRRDGGHVRGCWALDVALGKP